MKPPKTSRDWRGIQQPRPTVKGSVSDHRDDLNVTLVQQSRKHFAVIYGLQIKVGLDYASAALEYGLCVMHALACESRLEN